MNGFSMDRRTHAVWRFCAVALWMGLIASAWGQENTHYIRAGAPAGGDGSSWSQAWSVLPSTLVRGHTYYLADGTYPKYTFKTAVSGEMYIYILKATEANHGTDTGWQSSYGDGTALFTDYCADFGAVISFTTDYWVFDGQVGSGRSGHGFKVIPSNTDTGAFVFRIDNGADYIKVYHTEIAHHSMGELGVIYKRTKGVYAVSSSDGGSQHLHFAYNYMHHFTTVMMQLSYVRNMLIEHNFIEARLGGDYSVGNPIHGEAIRFAEGGQDARNVVRFNTLKDIGGTAFIANQDSIESGYYYYGNIFFNTDDVFTVGNGTIANSSGDTQTSMYIYNNTFYNIRGHNTGVLFYNGANNFVKNNLWVDCDKVSFSGLEYSHNTYANTTTNHTSELNGQWLSSSAGALLVAPTTFDFRLLGPTAGGLSVSIPNDVLPGVERDPLGILRAGTDGVWDRGAYEFSGVTDDQAPSTPEGFAVTGVTDASITLSWQEASDNVSIAGYELHRTLAGTTVILMAPTNQYVDTDVSPSTTYGYQVRAYDLAGNRSPLSPSVSATTEAPGMPEISIADSSVPEGSAGVSEATIELTLSSASVDPVTVAYITSDGTATLADNDYQSTSGTAAFAVGSVATSFNVSVVGDQNLESDETIRILLSNPVNATIADGEGLLTIVNDDHYLEEGLLAYWTFEETEGAALAEITGNVTGSALVGDPQYKPGVMGGGVQFDGTDDYANLALLFSVSTTAFSVSSWVYLDGTRSGYETLLGCGVNAHPFSIRIDRGSGKVYYRVRADGGDVLIASEASLNSERWYHIASVYDNGAARLYINGILNGESSTTGNLKIYSSALTGASDGSSEFLAGWMDDTRIYSRAITQSEINILSDQVPPAPPSGLRIAAP